MYSIVAHLERINLPNDYVDYYDFSLHKGAVPNSFYIEDDEKMFLLFKLLQRLQLVSQSTDLTNLRNRERFLNKVFLSSRKSKVKNKSVKAYAHWKHILEKYEKESSRVDAILADLDKEFKKLPIDVIRSIYPFITMSSNAEPLRFSLYQFLKRQRV